MIYGNNKNNNVDRPYYKCTCREKNKDDPLG